MTGGAWIAFGTVEALLGFACIRAWQLWGDRTNAFDTIPAERLRAFPATMFTGFAWIGLFMLAIALGATAPVLVLAVLAIPAWLVIRRLPDAIVPPHLRHGARRPEPEVLERRALEPPEAEHRLRSPRAFTPLVVAALFLLATVPGFGPWPLLVGLLAGGAAAARQGGLRVPVLVLSPERVEIGNWHDRRKYAWRDVRGLALVKLSPTRPPIVALQLRTGALRRVDALYTLGSVEQKGLAGPLKREGITRT
jgi:hypothetical protein